MAHHSEGGSASVRSNGSEAEQGGRTAVDVERLALQAERASHCLAAGNERSAARQLRRFWADYLAVVGPEAATDATTSARPDLAGRARRAREAGVVDDDLADALVTFAARDAGVEATARLLDLTTSHLDGRLG